jgi:hypothetical protein
MKKYIILFLMISVAVSGFAADSVDVYESHYNVAATHANQLEILQDMAKTQPADADEFYRKALRKLVGEYANIKEDGEKRNADEQAIILATRLGEAKYAPAASDLWQVASRFDSPMARADAMIALGNIPAKKSYRDNIIRVLNNMNEKPTPNRLYGERIAYGAIIALERFKELDGYIPVFMASIGWYSEGLREQAKKTLSVIDQDPSSYMMNILKGAKYDQDAKFAALQNIEASAVDSKKKVEIAVEALNQGWTIKATGEETKIIIAEMRKQAINMINRYKSDNQAIYRLLERSSSQGSLDEKFAAIATLASQGTEEAAKRLSNILVDLNNKRLRNNIIQEDEQVVRAVIPALGQLGHPQGRSSLSAVSASNWPPAVVRLADDALEQLRK